MQFNYTIVGDTMAEDISQKCKEEAHDFSRGLVTPS